MKLVDILARELKAWPSDDVFAITQDEGGALNGNTLEDPPVLKNTAWGSGAFYLDDPLNSADLYVLTQSDDYQSAIITRTQWQAAVDALKAEKEKVTGIDWSKAPEGATHYGPAVEGQWLSCWYKKVDGQWLGWLADGDTQWGPSGNTVERMKQLISRPQDWTGEGLPPVGSHVVVVDDGSLIYGQGESGEVLAHVDGTAVIRMSYGLGCFLPRCLRTKEQIAAEEQAKAIDLAMRMINTTTMVPGDQARQNIARHVVETMIKDGYRKFEIVDKDDGEGEV